MKHKSVSVVVSLFIVVMVYIATLTICEHYRAIGDNTSVVQISEEEAIYINDFTDTSFAKLTQHAFSMFVGAMSGGIFFIIFSILNHNKQ